MPLVERCEPLPWDPTSHLPSLTMRREILPLQLHQCTRAFLLEVSTQRSGAQLVLVPTHGGWGEMKGSPEKPVAQHRVRKAGVAGEPPFTGGSIAGQSDILGPEAVHQPLRLDVRVVAVVKRFACCVCARASHSLCA